MSAARSALLTTDHVDVFGQVAVHLGGREAHLEQTGLSALLPRGESPRARADLRPSTEATRAAAGNNSGVRLLPSDGEGGTSTNGPGRGQSAQNGTRAPLSRKAVSNTPRRANRLQPGQRTFPKSSSNSGDHSCMRVSMSGIGLPGNKRTRTSGSHATEMASHCQTAVTGTACVPASCERAAHLLKVNTGTSTDHNKPKPATLQVLCAS